MYCQNFPGVKTVNVKSPRLKYKVVACFDPIFEGAEVRVQTVARFSAIGDANIYATSLERSPTVTYINIEY
jgi:hypothetical protein